MSRKSLIFLTSMVPNQFNKKRKLWANLLAKKRSIDGICLFLRDFNAVHHQSEGINSKFCCITAIDFNNFIAKAGLHDFNLRSKKLMYMCDEGIKLCKLDRYLVCSNYITKQPLSMVIVLAREHSQAIE